MSALGEIEGRGDGGCVLDAVAPAADGGAAAAEVLAAFVAGEPVRAAVGFLVEVPAGCQVLELLCCGGCGGVQGCGMVCGGGGASGGVRGAGICEWAAAAAEATAGGNWIA